MPKYQSFAIRTSTREGSYVIREEEVRCGHEHYVLGAAIECESQLARQYISAHVRVFEVDNGVGGWRPLTEDELAQAGAR